MLYLKVSRCSPELRNELPALLSKVTLDERKLTGPSSIIILLIFIYE